MIGADMRLAKLVLVVALFGAALPQAAMAQELPDVIRDDQASSLKECDPPLTSVPAEAISTADFNGDGKPDYIIDYNNVCTAFCGSAGCTYDIYVSQGDTWTKAFSENIRAIQKRVTRNGKTVLLVDMHGSVCDKVGASVCPRQIRWDGKRLRLEKR
jgi:hypothetical protein